MTRDNGVGDGIIKSSPDPKDRGNSTYATLRQNPEAEEEILSVTFVGDIVAGGGTSYANGVGCGLRGKALRCLPLSRERKCPSVLHSISPVPRICKLYLGVFVERLHCEHERTRHEVHDRSPRPDRRFCRSEHCRSERSRLRPRCIPRWLCRPARGGWLSQRCRSSPRGGRISKRHSGSSRHCGPSWSRSSTLMTTLR